MSLLLLYLVMLKATMTTFNGPMSLPILRGELVTKRHVLSDRELTAAVTVAQASPGPMGIYVVGVGFFVAGVPGAIAGILAMLTPAIVSIPLARLATKWIERDRVKQAMQAAVLASAGLIATSALPLARASFRDSLHFVIAIVTFVVGVRTRVPTAVLLLVAGATGIAASVLVL